MKPKMELISSKKLLKYVLIGLIVLLGLSCLYNGSYFAPVLPRADESAFLSTDDGAESVFVHKRDYFDELFEDQEHNPEVPKSIPVSCNYDILVQLLLFISSFIIVLLWKVDEWLFIVTVVFNF